MAASPPDDWLERWLPLLATKAGGQAVLEIGCGHGEDTATLAGAGLRVIAFDLSPAAVSAARARVPSAVIDCRDVRDPFPDQAHGLGVVVASLSLHYFGWAETVALARRVHAVLRPGGVLLCRLNSTEDRYFGATGHPEVEPNYFLVDGKSKRFFDEPAVRSLFASGWSIHSLEHRTTLKYVKPKSVWEAVLVRQG
jgi:SAM-dependent methyltransferase